ncbi:hypothetical protein Poly51_42550 [Rubripirellula tenax]|uniref:Uncharacterized protein n=1 Tax=Rubripirellula tenax TaxID=2528015 RepID=A0A5C6EPE6_9BACT|nr:hypothetical protein Poly51_42550 [Rubripirellula tenax]
MSATRGEAGAFRLQPQRQLLSRAFTPTVSESKEIRLDYFEKTGVATIQLGRNSDLFAGIVSSAYLRTV